MRPTAATARPARHRVIHAPKRRGPHGAGRASTTHAHAAAAQFADDHGMPSRSCATHAGASNPAGSRPCPAPAAGNRWRRHPAQPRLSGGCAAPADDRRRNHARSVANHSGRPTANHRSPPVVGNAASSCDSATRSSARSRRTARRAKSVTATALSVGGCSPVGEATKSPAATRNAGGGTRTGSRPNG